MIVVPVHGTHDSRFLMRPLANASVGLFGWQFCSVFFFFALLLPFSFPFSLFAPCPTPLPSILTDRPHSRNCQPSCVCQSKTNCVWLAKPAVVGWRPAVFTKPGRYSSNDDSASVLASRTRVPGRPSFSLVFNCFIHCVYNLFSVNNVYVFRRAIHWAILVVQGCAQLYWKKKNDRNITIAT